MRQATLFLGVLFFCADAGRAAETGPVLSVTDLKFTAFEGGDSPPPQFFGATAPQPVRLAIRTDGGAWLSVRPPAVSTPARIQVSANSSGLKPGSYSARVIVSASGLADQAVRVTLDVQTRAPQLDASPDVLRLTSTRGATDPVEQAIFLRNSGGGGAIRFRASLIDPPPGLKLLTQSGQTAPDAQVEVRVQLDPTGVEDGGYRGLVRIESDAGTRDVAVSILTGVTGPVLGLNLTGVRFEARQGNGNSNTRNFLVLNSGSGSVNWQAEVIAGADWLSIGMAVARGSATLRNAGRLSVSAIPGDLAPGTYYGLIRVSDPLALNSPQYLTAVLSVASANEVAEPDPSPQGLFFVGDSGQPPPPIQPIRLFVSSNDPVPYQTSVSTVDGANWLKAEPATGFTSTQNVQILNVTADAGNLKPGIYTGDVTVAFAGRDIRTTNITIVVPPRTVPTASSKESPRLAGCTPSKLSLTQTGLVNSFNSPAGWPAPLIVRLADDCGDPVLDAQMIATFSNGDPALPMKLTNPQVGLYSATWTPARVASQVRVVARATSPTLGTSTTEIIGGVDQNKAPVLLRNATLSNLNPVAGAPLAPGAVARIFGTDLAPSRAEAPSGPLPPSLNGVTVLVGAREAPVYFVSPDQINVQIPWETEPGREHTLVVSTNGGFTLPDSITVTPVRPGLYTSQDNGLVVALHLDGTFVTPSAPAKPGEDVIVYLEAMGITAPAVADGAPGPIDPPAAPQAQPGITIDDQEANIVWARLTPGIVGSYQIRFTVPPGSRTGVLPMWAHQNNVASNAGALAVGP